ncbi:MAG: hypothetical protein ACOC36_05490, partial [Fibrobacterota bacterium]
QNISGILCIDSARKHSVECPVLNPDLVNINTNPETADREIVFLIVVWWRVVSLRRNNRSGSALVISYLIGVSSVF